MSQSSSYIGAAVVVSLWLCSRYFASSHNKVTTTKLNGPSSSNWLLGLSRLISQSPDVGAVYEEWAAQYGSVFQFPFTFGEKKIVLTDPKALVHFYTSERSIYVKTENDRYFIGKIFGRGVLWAEGEMHKRQRKALTPAFSNAAIRRLTAVFYDSAYKVKSLWDATLEASPESSAVIDVQDWMNRVALDSIGIAGFSHDFEYIAGQSSPVTRAFESFQTMPTSFLSDMVFILSMKFPFILSLPTERMRLFWELNRSVTVIAQKLLASTRREKESNVAEEFTDKSVIGLLLKSEMAAGQLHMTQEEIVAQMVREVLVFSLVLFVLQRTFFCYETTSVSLTWALIELCKHTDIQDKLRKELSRFNTSDPTWDQLMSSELPYLDAVVQETLRLHPSVVETLRVASCDDVIPLSTPIVDAAGNTVASITVAKGTPILAPIRSVNRSEALWGKDAKEFIPERWFSNIDVPAKELQGYRHLLTFHDGPRTCLGKAFALAEFKACLPPFMCVFIANFCAQSVLSVLVRNYVFEFESPDVVIENHVAIVPRPRIAGETGTRVPLRVKRAE
ncbi:Cytochrome P450 [Mycena indigotica]|uniref:Cytochrome P450 n=1 Tax=Mycena indigotica TaxID=2126181 RepID=A0A8H6SJV6_9AGAR|nr:Cytochrome P450 [Mycena indigotica]KAF7301040.1 Cytochrome P450 [Mycena indigotica]